MVKKTLSNCKNRIISKYKEKTSIQSNGIYLLAIIFSPTLFISGCIKENPPTRLLTKIKFTSSLKVLTLRDFEYQRVEFVKKLTKTRQTYILKKINTFYFGVSLVSVFILLIFMCEPLSDFILNIPTLFIVITSSIWGYFLLSRNNEIFLAFLFDALDKIDRKKSNSDLTISDRLKLSFKSYIELIINFSILYFLFPMNYWKECNMPNSILENLYFSGVTITTLGYGDYSPIHWFPQFLTIYEVFCGFILIIVCFTIYTNIPHSQEGQK
jgi:voltage-gated potassium channel